MKLIKKNPFLILTAVIVSVLSIAVVYKIEKKRLIGKLVTAENSVVSENTEQAKEALADNDALPQIQGADEQIIKEEDQVPAVSLPAADEYPLHKNITVTYFWAGEEAGEDNKNISNLPSAWDEKWVKHYGGVDDPKKRDGYLPAKFTPKENPFYFALPYNDFDNKGKRKDEVLKLAGWANDTEWEDDESVCKNQWIRIIKDGKSAYAQWEDVGPFKENDAAYVFGNAQPSSKTNQHAGLDVSPAVKDYLGLDDIDKVDWQFVDGDQIPDGPWKKVVTTSQTYWN